jgi:hypothetical protein
MSAFAGRFYALEQGRAITMRGGRAS